MIVRLLVEAGASTTAHCPEASGRAGDTPLMAALRSSRPFIKNVVVHRFLEAQVASTRGFCSTALVEAVVSSSHEKRELRRALAAAWLDQPDAEERYARLLATAGYDEALQPSKASHPFVVSVHCTGSAFVERREIDAQIDADRLMALRVQLDLDRFAI